MKVRRRDLHLTVAPVSRALRVAHASTSERTLMSFHPEQSADRRALTRSDAPAALHALHSLSATLEDLDCAYEADLETVRTSDAPIVIKQTVIDTLRQRHQEHRALYIRELQELEKHSRTSGGHPL